MNPNSKRYCRVCDTITTFQYSKKIGHSECAICGSRFGWKIEDLVKVAKLLESDYFKRLEHINNLEEINSKV